MMRIGRDGAERPNKSVPPSIPTNSRKYGNHLRLTRGNAVHYYCINCGKYAFTRDKVWHIPPYKNIYCSKKCDEEGFPKWARWLVFAFLLMVWGSWLTGG